MLHVALQSFKPVCLKTFFKKRVLPCVVPVQPPISLPQANRAYDVMKVDASQDNASMADFKKQVMVTKRGLHLMFCYSYMIGLDASTVIRMFGGKAWPPILALSTDQARPDRRWLVLMSSSTRWR